MAMSVETKARRAAARKEEKRLAALKPIADKVVVLDAAREEIEVELFGAKVTGYINFVNAVIEAAGFRPVRLTRNMLNPNSPVFAIDINTPAYCDPGCESYHSM